MFDEIYMRFELTDDEIAEINILHTEVENELARLNLTYSDSEYSKLWSDMAKKVSAIRDKAHTRALKYFASHTDELIKALRGEAGQCAFYMSSLEHIRNVPQSIDFWRNSAIRAISIYSELLPPEAQSDLLEFVDYAFTNREKIYRDFQKAIQRGQKGRTGYARMLNGPGLNNGLRASKRRMKRKEKITPAGLETIGEQVISGVLVELSNFDRLSLTDITRRILHILIIKLTEKAPYGAGITAEQIAKARRVPLSLDEYMSFCGLTDRKEAQKQLRNHAYTLFNLYMTWDEECYEINPATGKKKRKKTHWNTRLFDSTKEVMNLDEDPVIDSTITFNFTYDLVKYLCQKYIMPFNLRALSINPHIHPYASSLAYKLMEHYNENIAKHKHIRISVESLLKAYPEMLTPEEVKESAKSKYWERIRDPFERDMFALRDKYGIIEEWHYCNSGGEPLSDEQQTECKFKNWLQWLVEYSLKDYPEPPKPKTHKRRKDTKPKAIALPAKSE